MKLYPKKLKYKKYHKTNANFLKLSETKLISPENGNFAILAAESGKLRSNHIEACRRTLRRALGKLVKLWIRVFTSRPVSAKPLTARMGKGKGSTKYWIAPVKKGQVLFEVLTQNECRTYLALERAAAMLPIKAYIIELRY